MTKIAITGEGSTDYGKKDYRTEKEFQLESLRF